MNAQILAWHRRNMEEANAEMIKRGTCISTVSHPDDAVPAVHLWHARPGPAGLGNVIPLCEECCCRWRANATEDGSLGPDRITPMPR